MVDHNKLRNQLMDGAIKAVSIYGLEGLTTRSIEQQCKLKEKNDVILYGNLVGNISYHALMFASFMLDTIIQHILLSRLFLNILIFAKCL